MPRLVALKHPDWTGKVVRVSEPAKSCLVVILGTDARGSALVGRQSGSRVLWTFWGEDYPNKPGLPSWCTVVEDQQA